NVARAEICFAQTQVDITTACRILSATKWTWVKRSNSYDSSEPLIAGAHAGKSCRAHFAASSAQNLLGDNDHAYRMETVGYPCSAGPRSHIVIEFRCQRARSGAGKSRYECRLSAAKRGLYPSVGYL